MLKIVAKKKRDKPKEKDKDKKGGKGKTKNAYFGDPYEEDFPWRVPPMSKVEILQAIRDGPSLYELQRKAKSVGLHDGSDLNPTKHVQLNGAYIESSELDKISPKTHDEKFFEPVQFKTFEDFVKSSYHDKFAALNKRETPLSKSDFEEDIMSSY